MDEEKKEGVGTNLEATAKIAKGVDISEHQGAVDFEKLKAAGIKFVMVRAGYGKNHIDKYFTRNAKECQTHGIPMGVYWFSYALTEEDAKKEAQYCLAAVKQYKLHYPVCYDLEYDSVRYAKTQNITIDKKLATAMAIAFCTEVQKARYYAANYSNADYAANMFDKTVFEKFDLWYASYCSTCGRKDAGLWQYSDKGVLYDKNKYFDMDYSFKNYPHIIKKAGLNGL